MTTAEPMMAVSDSFGRQLGRRAGTVEVGLVIPLSGPAGMFGPSCYACATLAAGEMNADGGVLGRQVRLTPIDGGQHPDRVADAVDRLVSAGRVDVVVGWHISAVRAVLAPRLRDRIPYVYTALYEGGERSPGVFLTGETPVRQVGGALSWLVSEQGWRRWSVVGDDYVWPRKTAVAVRRFARDLGAEISNELFVGLGEDDFEGVVRRLSRAQTDAVLLFLVGEDAVRFNRVFAGAGLDQQMARFSPLMDENMLLGSGAGCTRNLYVSAGYFGSLTTRSALDFAGLYGARFGMEAPALNSPGESCYEGLRLLGALAKRAGTLAVPGMMAAAEDHQVGYDGPRGSMQLVCSHLKQDIYLAQADGLEFDVLARL